MNTSPWIQVGLFIIVLFSIAWPLGHYLVNVFDDRQANRFAWLHNFEHRFCRFIGTNPEEDMPWQHYAIALVLFNLLGVVVVYSLQCLQGGLPLNPQALGAISPDSALNTAVSFVTNTNWQGYGGESTMSYLTQMLALTVQNFASAATGIAVVIALIRGFIRKNASGIGNVWLDLFRSVFYVLLPLSFIFSVALVNQGVIQNFSAYQDVKLMEPVEYVESKKDHDNQLLMDDQGSLIMKTVKSDKQLIAMGPVASQEAIKLLGTNGGGFFNANSAHPFENPTPLTNFLEMISIFLIPVALCFAFGQMVGDARQGWTILIAMSALFIVMVSAAIWSESQSNPLIAQLGVDDSVGNLEGKEIRFGIISSALFAAVTTAASCGAVNSMHDSFLPLGGLIPLGLMMLGEVVFGGVGSGLYGMLIFAMLAVFLSGLMIGRTPEYLGKKISIFEMKMISIAILIVPFVVLSGAAIAVIIEIGKAGMTNPGAHGLSEVLYAFTSAGNNNGSAFAGLSANTPFYNISLAIAMWIGRFGVIIPILAIAGKLAAKPKLTVTSGTLPTHGPLFVLLLISTVIIIGALNYIPTLALGPIIEHLQLFARQQ